jgi:hypothetical protein
MTSQASSSNVWVGTRQDASHAARTWILLPRLALRDAGSRRKRKTIYDRTLLCAAGALRETVGLRQL